MSHQKLGPEEDPRDAIDIAGEIVDMYQTEMGYDSEDGGTYPNAVIHVRRDHDVVNVGLRNGRTFTIRVERTN